MDRSRLRMDDQEVRAFLDAHRVAVLAGRDPLGAMTGRRVSYERRADTLVLTLEPAGPGLDVDAHPELCLIVDVYPGWDTGRIKGVVVQGAGRWIDRDQRIELRLGSIVSFDFTKAARP